MNKLIHMKLVFVVLLIPLYLLVSFKFTLNIHYCGGQVNKVSIFKISEKDCCGVEEEMSGGCCSNDKITLKTDNHECQLYKFNLLSASNQFILFSPPTFFVYNFSTQKIAKTESIIEDPPLSSSTSLYLRFRVLLI